ncbi:MAG: tRNA (adenosine(37)-N6)-threonylcarbamoyltransferase complex dimerization subunit type 1 TsaB [Crocinitomicaceae bacterium]|nr:tRNA (adenosine(37)-N6)-threonylcarbamoyltransferase complex dimerization subunit type 1 TsaB [Crocinitomicaceae bacterium]
MILHIETATKICSVALSQKGTLLDIIEDDETGYTHAENLTFFIQTLLERNGVVWQDIEAIAVTSGPGSYTGLRIGVSTAKGLCYGLGIPLIAVDALRSIAAQMQALYPGKTYLPMIDARRMEVFSAIYNSNLEEIRTIQADILTKDSYEEYQGLVIAGDGVTKLKEIWAHRKDIIWASNVKSSSRGQVPIATQKFEKKRFEDVAYFEPYYLKDFK